MRLDATRTLLALAGVRPADDAGEERAASDLQQQRPAVLLNLFVGGGEDKGIQVIDGEARGTGNPIRLAGEVVKALAGPGSRGQ